MPVIKVVHWEGVARKGRALPAATRYRFKTVSRGGSAIASIFVTKSESNHSFQPGHMHLKTGSLLGRPRAALLAAAPRAGQAGRVCACNELTYVPYREAGRGMVRLSCRKKPEPQPEPAPEPEPEPEPELATEATLISLHIALPPRITGHRPARRTLAEMAAGARRELNCAGIGTGLSRRGNEVVGWHCDIVVADPPMADRPLLNSAQLRGCAQLTARCSSRFSSRF